MYLKHFGFDQKPFNITPNPEFMFLSGTHKEVFAHLLYGVQNHSGFIEVTGEVGTGKTTVLRTLFNQLDDSSCRLALIFNPSLTALELLQNINREFGIDCQAESLSGLQHALNAYLLDENKAGRTVVLVIDEAQNLSPDVLEQIRLLSNLETETDKLIQIILVGQPELASMLDRPDLRQLRQRITVRYQLESMGQDDVLRYIMHRVSVAGQPRRDLFDPMALQLIVKKTQGNPRLINVLCDRSLLVAFSDDSSQVQKSHVQQALQELWREEGGQQAPGRGRVYSCLLLVALSGFVGWTLYQNKHSEKLNEIESTSVSSPIVEQQSVTPPPTPPAPTVPPEIMPPEKPNPLPSLADRVSALRVDLRTDSRNQNLDAAFNALANLWEIESFPPDQSLSPGMLRAEARKRGLDLTTFAGSFADFLQFNLPAILELSLPGEEKQRFLALTGFDGSGFSIDPPVPSNKRLQIDELESLWSGHAYIIWKNHADIRYIGKPGQGGSSVLLLQQLLERAGYYSRQPSGTFDQETIDSVTRFQADFGLIQDGRIGPQTLILLYRSAGYGEVELDRPIALEEGV